MHALLGSVHRALHCSNTLVVVGSHWLPTAGRCHTYSEQVPPGLHKRVVYSEMCGTAQVRRSDVQSAWSGLRPLAVDPRAKDTASASRDHVVVTDPDGLITVTGARADG